VTALPFDVADEVERFFTNCTSGRTTLRLIQSGWRFNRLA